MPEGRVPGCAGDDRPSRLPGFAQVAQRLGGRWPPPALLSEMRPVAPERREALVPVSRVPGTDRVPGSNRGDRRRSRVAPRFFTSVPRDRMPKSEPGPSRPASGRPNGSPPHGRPGLRAGRTRRRHCERRRVDPRASPPALAPANDRRDAAPRAKMEDRLDRATDVLIPDQDLSYEPGHPWKPSGAQGGARGGSA